MSSKLVVKNLCSDTTEETLRTMFEQDGRVVESVSMVTDRATGRFRGFAFVEMASAREAASAVDDLDGEELDGRELQVSAVRGRL